MHLLVDDPLCLEHIFGQHTLEIFANTALELPAATVAAGHARPALADIFAQRELLFVFVGDEGSGLAGRPRRSDDRRVGPGGVSTCRARWSATTSKKTRKSVTQ